MNKSKTRWTAPRFYTLPVLLLVTYFCANGQPSTHYAVQANIIYHFSKYIEWPADKMSGPFIIGIVGESPLYGELSKNMKGKKAGEQAIVIKRYSSSTILDCHILFIADAEGDNIKKILASMGDKAVLVVTESEGLAKKGSCINFAIESDKLKLEINKKNIEARRLAIASELLQLGKVVK